jgi:hypothetical protein
LLLAHQLAKLVHLLAHRAALLLLALLPACLEIVHHALQFLQHLLSLIAGAGARQILDLVEHVVEIALAQHVLGHRLLHFGRIVLILPRQLLQELLHGFAQLIHQLGDFLIGCAVFQRFGKRILGITQAPFGERQIAIFKLQRNAPHVVDRLHADPRRTGHFQAGREPTARADNETGRGSFLPAQL